MSDWVTRFAVKSPDGTSRSGVWRCFRNRGQSDVYFGVIPALSVLKLSLHESGRWHVAFDRAYHERKTEEGFYVGRDRWLDRWERPKLGGPDPLVVFRVIIPAAGVNIPMDDRFQGKEVQWIKSPGVPLGVEVDLVLTPSGHDLEGWPGLEPVDAGVVASDSLPSGDRLWVVHRVGRPPSMAFPPAAKMHPLRDPQPDLRKEAKEGGLRALVAGIAEDGTRFFVETTVAPGE